MTTYQTLRDANLARERERDPKGLITPAYRGIELGGELVECLIVLNSLAQMLLARGEN